MDQMSLQSASIEFHFCLFVRIKYTIYDSATETFNHLQ